MTPLLSLVALLTAIAASPVAAQAPAEGETGAASDENDAVARDRFRRGTALFDAGDYERAADEFEAAYDLSRRPELLYNVYLANERLGNLAQAIAALEGYLAEGEPGERREALTSRLERLRVRLDEAREEEARQAAREQRLREAAVTRGPGALRWILAGGGGAIAAAGVVMLLVADADVRAVEEPGPSPRWADVSSQYERAPVLSTIGAIALGVGATALLTGLTWGLLTLGGGEEVQVAIGPGVVRAEGSF